MQRIIRIRRLSGEHITSTGPSEAWSFGFFGNAIVAIGEEFGWHPEDLDVNQTDDPDRYIATARGEPLCEVVVATRR